MKVYEAVYSDEQRQGVYGISLVENPAMQDEWILLSNQEKVEFAAIDESKRLLLGAVLIPNKKIYRNVGGNEFYITFSEDTIGNLAHDFIKNGFQNNSTSEHETKLSDVSFVESWQVEDPDKDKSNSFGKRYEKGTWVTMAKVSDEIYKEAQEGTFKGFSIDALLGLEEVNFKSNIKMTKQDFIKELKDIFSFSEKVDEKVEAVEVVSEEVIEPTTEEPTQEMTPEALEEIKNALGDYLSEFKAQVKKEIEDFKTELSKQDEVKETKIEELETELAKQPEVEPIKANPESVSEKVELKTDTIRGRVMANLVNVWQ